MEAFFQETCRQLFSLVGGFRPSQLEQLVDGSDLRVDLLDRVRLVPVAQHRTRNSGDVVRLQADEIFQHGCDLKRGRVLKLRASRCVGQVVST